MFAPQVEAFGDTYRVITWDERGFGSTEYDGKPFSYWDSAADCLGLLDHLGIDSAVLGGMSQGGFLSLRAALTAPERVRALILLDSQAGVDDPETFEGYDAMNHVWLTDGPTDEFAEVVAGDHHRRPGPQPGLDRQVAGAGQGPVPRAVPVLCGRATTSPIASVRSPVRRSSCTARRTLRSPWIVPRCMAAGLSRRR